MKQKLMFEWMDSLSLSEICLAGFAVCHAFCFPFAQSFGKIFHLCFSTWGSCNTAVLGDTWNAAETPSTPLPFSLIYCCICFECHVYSHSFEFDFCVVLKLLSVSLFLRALHTTPGLRLSSGLVINSQFCYWMAKIGISWEILYDMEVSRNEKPFLKILIWV